MKANKYLAVLIFITVSLYSFAQEPLDNYLIIAAENNPGLKAKFNEYLASLEKTSQARALPDPQISFGYFIQPIETRNEPQQFRVSATQVFPWFGSQGAKGNYAIQAAKTKFEVFQETKAKLFDEVRSTYFNLYFTKKAILIIDENLKFLKSFQQMALIKVEAGKVSAVDEFRIEMDINDLKNQQSLLKDNFYVQLIQFKNLVNDTADNPIIIPDNLWESNFELTKTELFDSIRILNHQLLRIDFERQLLVLREEVERINDKPVFTIGVDYINVGKGDNNLSGKDAFLFPKIGFSIPLSRKKQRAIVNETALLELGKDFEKMDKTNWLETVFELGYKDFNDADRRIDLYKTQTDLAKRSLKILETEYITSSKKFEELLRMERLILKYNLEFELAKTDKQIAISFINYLMGR